MPSAQNQIQIVDTHETSETLAITRLQRVGYQINRTLLIKRNYFNKVSFRLPACPSPAWVVVETIEFTSGQTGVASGATQTDKFDLGVA